jgi:hypothetical protein
LSGPVALLKGSFFMTARICSVSEFEVVLGLGHGLQLFDGSGELLLLVGRVVDVRAGGSGPMILVHFGGHQLLSLNGIALVGGREVNERSILCAAATSGA